MKKYFLVVLAFVAIVFVFSSFLCSKSRSVLTAPSGHVWTEYKNKKLGFAMAYPSDISRPYEDHQPATPNGFDGADTLRFFDDAREPNPLIFLWIAKTKATDAESWFYESGLTGQRIATTTTIGGVLAVGKREIMPSIAYDQYNLNFVHGGELWNLYIQDWRFSPQEIEYIGQSFRFLHWWERIQI